MGFFFFKQKAAYEILSGLVGSEMCIRGRFWLASGPATVLADPPGVTARSAIPCHARLPPCISRRGLLRPWGHCAKPLPHYLQGLNTSCQRCVPTCNLRHKSSMTVFHQSAELAAHLISTDLSNGGNTLMFVTTSCEYNRVSY